MDLYNYDDFGFFVGITQARLCPITERLRKVNPSIKQEYIVPANATIKPVPKYNADTQWVKFVNDEWVVEDIPIPSEPEIIYEEITESEPIYDPIFNYIEKLAPIIEGTKKITRWQVKPKENLDVSEVKEILIKNAKQKAYTKLCLTDWYIIRMVDTAVEIPQNIINERAAIRLACDYYCEAVNACETIEALQTVLHGAMKLDN